MEQPLPAINRISDLLWEKEKIAFEIQCSAISEAEASARCREYKTAGYQIVWVLDDRLFNKRQLRPAEEFLRTRPCYFASFKRSTPSLFYDQFEIFHRSRRVRRGNKIGIDFRKIHKIETVQWPEELPSQIARRIPNSPCYFVGDLLHRALLSTSIGAFARLIQYWRALESQSQRAERKKGIWKEFFLRWIAEPYLALLDALLKRTP